MTREELKAHCEKQIKECEKWAKYMGEEPHGKIYEEHKLILELLEQEPFKPMVEIDLYSVIKQKYIEREVIDKIRTEINGKYRVILKGTPKDDWAVRWNDCLDEVLKIIDKCTEESEED